MTPAQQRHEQGILEAHAKLITEPDKRLYWQLMVAGIQTRDPVVTQRLEAERLARVGL